MYNRSASVLFPLLIFFFLILNLFNLQTLEPEWQFPTGGIVLGNPAAGESGQIYALSEDRHIYCLEKSGEFRWKYYLRNLPSGVLTLGPDGTVYIPLSNGELAAVNPSGHEIWRFDMGDTSSFGASVSDWGLIYIVTDSSKLLCLDNRGSLRWQTTLSSKLSASITIIPEWGILCPQINGRLTAFNLSGEIRWQFLMAGAAGRIVSDGYNFFGCTDAGTIVSVSPEGKLLWNVSLSEKEPGSLLQEDGELFFLTPGRGVTHLYRWNTHGDFISDYHLASPPGYLGLGRNSIFHISGGGRVERLTLEGIPIGSHQIESNNNGLLLHDEGSLILAGRDWRLKGYVIEVPESESWNQDRGNSQRDGGSPPLISQPDRGGGADELYLRVMMRENGEAGRFHVLDTIQEGLEVGKYSGCESYILDILEILAGEGVLNPVYEGSSVLNDYPMVRKKAAGILAVCGTLHSQEILRTVFLYEWEPVAKSAQMEAMGIIGSDLFGRITLAIYKNLPGNVPAAEKQLYAVSALETLKNLINYYGTLPDPSALELIMDIYTGNYGRKARELALEIIRS